MRYIFVGGKLVEDPITEENPSRRKPHSWWAGYQTERKFADLGTYAVVVDAYEAGWCDAGGRWGIICARHNTIFNTTNLKLAREFMRSGPTEWCDYCRGEEYPFD
jgi:hypothetical protein